MTVSPTDGDGDTRGKLIGLSDQEAASLAGALKRIEIEGKPAIESVEAFGSRAGSTFRGRPPLPDSDLDIYITLDSNIVNSPDKYVEVIVQIHEVSDLLGRVKKFSVNPVIELDTIAPTHKLQFAGTPFIRLDVTE
jgi:hypothetical protein